MNLASIPLSIAGPAAGVSLLVMLGLGALSLGQHDQLVTWRLKDKDRQAVEYNLRRDIADRDQRVLDRAGGEAADRGEADKSCAAEISSSFQKGVAVGRAMNHAKSAPPSPPGARTDAGGVLDYRQSWEASAFKPASSGSASSGDLRPAGG